MEILLQTVVKIVNFAMVQKYKNQKITLLKKKMKINWIQKDFLISKSFKNC